MSILIKNGHLHTMTEQNVIDADLLIENGKIKKIAKNIEAEDAETKVWDAAGNNVYPGFIEPHCHIGISEERKGTMGDDCNESTTPITPYLRAIDGINPMDAAFTKAVRAGITTVNVGQGSNNPIGGQWLIMKTAGSRSIDDLLVKEPSAMKLAFGENPKVSYGDKDEMPATRMAIAAMIREELYKAKQYCEDRKDSSKKKEFKPDFRKECWVPVFEKKIPLKCHVHRADDIMTAIRIGKEFGLKVTLDHCSEGHLIVEEVKKSGYPVIVGPTMTSRSKQEVENLDFKTAGILNQAGILVAITTDHPVTLIETLPLCAGMVAKSGLGVLEAIRAITINPAKVLGISDRVGTLEEGKDADITIYEGNPLEIFSNCLCTIIRGKVCYDSREQDE